MNDSGWIESCEGELDPDLTDDWCDVDEHHYKDAEESHLITAVMCGGLLIVMVFPMIYFLFR